MQKDPSARQSLCSVWKGSTNPTSKKGRRWGEGRERRETLWHVLPCLSDAGCIFQGLNEAGGETKMGVWLQGTVMLRTKNQQHSVGTPISNAFYNTNFSVQWNNNSVNNKCGRWLTTYWVIISISLRVLALILALWQPSAPGSNIIPTVQMETLRHNKVK